MKYTFTLLLLLSFLFRAEEARAQDPYFAQFYAAPLHVNPAFTGVFQGEWRVVANYRQQWNIVLGKNPFSTAGASFDMRSQIGRGDYLSYGINVMHDEVGAGNLTLDKGYLNLSYMKQLDGGRYRAGDQYLIAGVQGGFGQMSLDYPALWFSSMFDPIVEDVNFDQNSGEAFVDEKSDVYLDLNAGLMWYAVWDDNQSIYIGGSINHITQPNITFLGNTGNDLDMKWNAQIGGQIPFTRELSLLPAAYVMGQGPSLLSLFGGNFRYSNRDWREIAIRAGAWGHIGNTVNNVSWNNVVVTTVLEIERLQIGVSYDVNTGKVSQPTNARGGFEISLIYTSPSKTRIKTRCPEF